MYINNLYNVNLFPIEFNDINININFGVSVLLKIELNVLQTSSKETSDHKHYLFAMSV